MDQTRFKMGIMQLKEIISIYESGHLTEALLDNGGPELTESCWLELLNSNYPRKQELSVELIHTGMLDCDLRSETFGLTPMEQALSQNERSLVQAMINAEAKLYTEQRMIFRLVRRGSVELMELFVQSNKFSEVDMFRMLSYALEELRTKNVPTTKEMEKYCLKFLLGVLYSSQPPPVPSECERRAEIFTRIDLILIEIKLLRDHAEVNSGFLLSLNVISENLYAIDLLWNKDIPKLGTRSMWKQLRPQKIIFYVEILLAVLVKRVGFEECVLLVDVPFLLDLLEAIGRELEAIETNDRASGAQFLESLLLDMVRETDIHVCWNRKYPNRKLNRCMIRSVRKGRHCGLSADDRTYLQELLSKRKNFEQLQQQWNDLDLKVRLSKKIWHWAIETVRRRSKTERSKPFSERLLPSTRSLLKELDVRHDAIKNLYSLRKMMSCVQALKDLPLNEANARTFGFAAFRRALLMIGESCKSTRATPNVCSRLYAIMSRQNSRFVFKTYENQRNAFAHGMTLTDLNLRLRIERGELDGILLKSCLAMQDDLRRSNRILEFNWTFVLVKTIRFCVGRFVKLRSVTQCRDYSFLIGLILSREFMIEEGKGLLYNFDQINAELAKLAALVRGSELKEKIKSIYASIKIAQQEMVQFNKQLIEFKNTALRQIRGLMYADDLRVVKRSLISLLKNPINYFYINALDTMDQISKTIDAILTSHQVSSTIDESLMKLKQCILYKEDRREDLRKLFYHQFVPYQNEQYTEELLRSLKVNLEMQEFYTFHEALTSKIYDPLHPKNKANIFQCGKKIDIVEQQLNDRQISYDRSAIGELRKSDNRRFQLIFEQLLQTLHDLASDSLRHRDQYDQARQLALQMGLLEICQALSHTAPFQLNLNSLNVPFPIIYGKLLRNVVAHDIVQAGTVFFCSPDVILLTVQVLYEQRFTIMEERSDRVPFPLYDPVQKFDRRKAYLKDQKILGEMKPSDLSIMIANQNFDIYGHFYFVRRESREVWHNLLDVLLLNYPDEAIRYHELVAKGSTIDRSTFGYLWKRLQSSELLGSKPKRLSQRESDFDAESKTQIDNLLKYCMITDRLDKFAELYQCYGKRFDFAAESNFVLPSFVEKLGHLLPWTAVDQVGCNWIHLFSFANNVQAMRDALKRPEVRGLIAKPDQRGVTPLQMACCHYRLEIAEMLLRHLDASQLDSKTLILVIASGRNDLLKYFLPFLENHLAENPQALRTILKCSVGNINAVDYLRTSMKSFDDILSRNRDGSILYSAIFTKQNRGTIKQLLSIPGNSETINVCYQNLTALALDMEQGRCKRITTLLRHGAIVDYHVIRRAVQYNCRRYLKRLLDKLETPLSDEELLNIIHHIVSQESKPQLLKFFVEKLVNRDLSWTFLETTIHRHQFQYIRYLIETFPAILPQCERNSAVHPVLAAMYTTHRWHSLNTENKETLKYLIDRCEHLLEQTSLLHEAVHYCDLEIIRHLADKQLPLDVQHNGFTPLAIAANLYTTTKTKYDILEFFLQRGADVQFLLNHKPEYLTHVHLMETILHKTPFNPAAPHPEVSFLHNACICGSLRLATILVERYHVDICRPHLDTSTLQVCVTFDSLEVLDYLVQRVTTREGRILREAATYAVQRGNLKAIQILVDRCSCFQSVECLQVLAFTAHFYRQPHVFAYLHQILELCVRLVEEGDGS